MRIRQIRREVGLFVLSKSFQPLIQYRLHESEVRNVFRDGPETRPPSFIQMLTGYPSIAGVHTCSLDSHLYR